MAVAAVAATAIVCVVAAVEATAAAVTAAVLAVTLVLTAAVLAACVEGEAVVVSARAGLAGDLVVVPGLDEGLALVRGLAATDAVPPPALSCASPFGVVDELPVWAPPLLLTTTPEPTSALDDVDPDVGDVPDVPGTEDDPVPPEPLADSVVPVVPVVPAVAVTPVFVGDPLVALPAAPEDVDPPGALIELDDDELADPPTVSATATP